MPTARAFLPPVFASLANEKEQDIENKKKKLISGKTKKDFEKIAISSDT
jgi:hypothetical protein